MKAITYAGVALSFATGISSQLLDISLGLGIGSKPASSSQNPSTLTTMTTATISRSGQSVILSSSSKAATAIKSSSTPAPASSSANTPGISSILPSAQTSHATPVTVAVSSNANVLSKAAGAILPSAISAAINASALLAESAELMSEVLVPQIRLVFSNADVAAAKLDGYCGVDKTTAAVCTSLQNTVALCVEMNNNCTDTAMRNVLLGVLGTELCKSTTKATAANVICAQWWTEAARCANAQKRGPCALGHVKYLLKWLRDFIGLNKTQKSIITKRAVQVSIWLKIRRWLSMA